MNPPESTLPTLAELVAAHQNEPFRGTKRKNWPCLDGLSKRDRDRALMMLWRHLNKEKKSASDKQWVRENPKRANAYKRAWAERNKEQLAAYQYDYNRSKQRREVWQKSYNKLKDHHSARRKAWRAVRRGVITRGPCEVCGDASDVEAHHDDYSKPLEVRWLCTKHHGEQHRKYQY